MYRAEDYLLFFLAVILFFGVLAAMGAFIEWQEGRRERARYREENRERLQRPRRRGSYRQEWDELLERKGGKPI